MRIWSHNRGEWVIRLVITFGVLISLVLSVLMGLAMGFEGFLGTVPLVLAVVLSRSAVVGPGIVQRRLV